MAKKISIAIIIVILGLVGVLYAKVWNPSWNPFGGKLRAEITLYKMVQKMALIKQFHSQSELNIAGEGGSGGNFRLTLKTETDSDNSNAENPKSAGNFEISFPIESLKSAEPSASAQTAQEEKLVSIKGENKTIAKDNYIKFTEFPKLSETDPKMAMVDFFLGFIKGQWIKIGESERENLMMTMMGENLTSAEKEKFKEEMAKREKVQKEFGEKVRKILNSKEGRKLFLVKSQLPSEKIAGREAYHLLLGLNQEALKKIIIKLYPDFFEIYKTYYPEEASKISKGDMQKAQEKFQKEFPSAFDDFFQKVGDINVEVWVGQKDYLLYRISTRKRMDMNKLTNGEEKGFLDIGFKMNLSKFGETVKIEPPAQYKSLEEILGPILQSMKIPNQKSPSPSFPLPVAP